MTYMPRAFIVPLFTLLLVLLFAGPAALYAQQPVPEGLSRPLAHTDDPERFVHSVRSAYESLPVEYQDLVLFLIFKYYYVALYENGRAGEFRQHNPADVMAYGFTGLRNMGLQAGQVSLASLALYLENKERYYPQVRDIFWGEWLAHAAAITLHIRQNRLYIYLPSPAEQGAKQKADTPQKTPDEDEFMRRLLRAREQARDLGM